MNCEKAGRFLDAYLDHELEVGKRFELDQHLGDCPDVARTTMTIHRILRRKCSLLQGAVRPRAKVVARLFRESDRTTLIAIFRRPWLYAMAMLVLTDQIKERLK
jgi:anti-sigma factor RsiW